MGRLAEDVQARIRDRLDERLPGYTWEVEGRLGGTPVDVVGSAAGRIVAVELEWRRADPADNSAKLFRHLAEGTVGGDRIAVVQVFTAYYDLASGGVSSKRQNAEFVGGAAAETLPEFEYHAVDLGIDPPRGDGRPDDGWESELAATVDRIAALV